MIYRISRFSDGSEYVTLPKSLFLLVLNQHPRLLGVRDILYALVFKKILINAVVEQRTNNS